MNARAAAEQLELDVEAMGVAEAGAVARTYWENAGPRRWQEVVVRVRYGPAARTVPGPVLPLVRTGKAGPRNVLVERPDGTAVVRPVRLLRVRRPG